VTPPGIGGLPPGIGVGVRARGLAASAAGPPARPWLRGRGRSPGPRGLGCGVRRGLGGPGFGFQHLAEAPAGACGLWLLGLALG
jgi:hypothetical protein